MRKPLFRDEVQQSRGTQWLGSIRVSLKPVYAWATGVSLVLLAGLLAFATLVEVHRKSRVQGVLLPRGGLIGVSTPQAGMVETLFVKEGDAVKAGDPIARIRTERNLGQGDLALLNGRALALRRQSLETEKQLTLQQARQRGEALRDRLRSLQAEERQALGEWEASQARAQLARASVERFNALAREGYVSAAQTQQKQEELLDVQMRERSVERNLAALRRDIGSVQADLAANETGARTALGLVERNLASLSQEENENRARAEVLIRAPQEGRVAALLVTRGQGVQTAQSLASLTPATAAGDGEDQLEAQLFAPSRTSGFVRPGQTVWIRYAAYPHQKFGMARGTVTSVSQAPLTAQELAANRGASLMSSAPPSDPLYRIRVELDRQDIRAYGSRQPLRPGMSLNADIVQQRMRIWEWVLDPVLTLASYARAPARGGDAGQEEAP